VHVENSSCIINLHYMLHAVVPRTKLIIALNGRQCSYIIDDKPPAWLVVNRIIKTGFRAAYHIWCVF